MLSWQVAYRSTP